MAAALWAAPAQDRGEVQALDTAGSGPGVPRTEAQAMAAARTSGRPVEVESKGDARQVTYANPDGTLTRESHLQPFRTLRAGRWVPIDTTLIRHDDGTVGPKAAETEMRFSGGGRAPLATISRTGRMLTLTWPEELPKPTLDGDSATYADVWPDVDLVVHASVSSFTHVLVVKTPQAARLAQLKTIAYGLSGTNLAFKAGADGRLAALDAGGGGTIFEAPAPKMWDSGSPAEAAARGESFDASRTAPESSRRSGLGVIVAGGELRLSPDQRLLTDPSARFPIYIDPHVATHKNTKWAMVDSGYPNEEYYNWDGDTDQRIGLCPRGYSSTCNSSQVKRLLFTMDSPYADDSISILSAEFKVSMASIVVSGTKRNFSLYRTSGFSSATNWSNQPAWSSTNKQQTLDTSTTASCTGNPNVVFNATQAVRTAATDNYSTLTFGIKADNESDELSSKRFCHNAVLSVNYNRPPRAPDNLSSNPGGSCATGSARPIVPTVPVLIAYLSDPDTGDAEPLTATFTVEWTPAGQNKQTKTWTTLSSTSPEFEYNLNASGTGVPDLPENTVVTWKVIASDGTSPSPASPTCEFVLDKSRPAGPDIDSPEYLPGDSVDNGTGMPAAACVQAAAIHDGVGRYGTFTFTAADPDVLSYQYAFDSTLSAGSPSVPASAVGGSASVHWAPASEGPHTLNVRAVDASGPGTISSCSFKVSAGRQPVGEWALDDEVGSTVAADAAVPGNPAAAGSGVSFRAGGAGGPADPAAQLDGSAEGYLATSSTGLLDTGGPFSVSAWVKLDDLTRSQTAVSQDGTGEPGFVLGYEYEAGVGRWTFRIPVTDVDSLGEWQVHSNVAVSTDWVHLAATFDPFKDAITLYVGGAATTVGAARSSWASHGNIQIGRHTAKTGYTGHWNGRIADVEVYDRLVQPAEITKLAAISIKRRAYWPMDSSSLLDGTSQTLRSAAFDPDGEGPIDSTVDDLTVEGADQVLAVIPEDPEELPTEALVGEGHLNFNGSSDYAFTASKLVGQTTSFSISARVRLAAQCANEQVVMSQPGTNVSRFEVRCLATPQGNRWQLVLNDVDQVGSAQTIVTDNTHAPDPSLAKGEHLAVTYNGLTGEVKLYVRGELALSAIATLTTAWNGSDGGIQIGRALTGAGAGLYNRFFSGDIDEVRIYTGVIDETTVAQLSSTTALPDL
ncbi:LamG domain-containing protein [Catellatospora coxensis]|uniref:LamG-like jellyroll fold domain-containing protein n=1 Tax=Catellatospora coxensis TaxID=310354 RepID=A0A8J3KKN1_9ACTN|nr:hypothetical protein Cco03nite_14670 [Catellatospora coxensis]